MVKSISQKVVIARQRVLQSTGNAKNKDLKAA